METSLAIQQHLIWHGSLYANGATDIKRDENLQSEAKREKFSVSIEVKMERDGGRWIFFFFLSPNFFSKFFSFADIPIRYGSRYLEYPP